MISLDDLIDELKSLTPEQLDRVAEMIHRLSAPASRPPFPAEIIDQAVKNGWPAKLFTEVIGSLGDDFERPPQPQFDVRAPL